MVSGRSTTWRGGQVGHQVARGLLADEARRRAAGSAPAPRATSPAGRGRPPGRGPAVGASTPARIDSSVDLPEPDAPTIATISPSCDQQVEALQRLHLDDLGLVDPHQVVADDEGVAAELGRAGRAGGRVGVRGGTKACQRAPPCVVPGVAGR